VHWWENANIENIIKFPTSKSQNSDAPKTVFYSNHVVRQFFSISQYSETFSGQLSLLPSVGWETWLVVISVETFSNGKSTLLTQTEPSDATNMKGSKRQQHLNNKPHKDDKTLMYNNMQCSTSSKQY